MAYRDRIPASSGASLTNPSNARNELFGTRSGNAPDRRALAEHTEHMMESENDRIVGQLSQKIQLLKSLTISIGDEARADNAMLDDMHGDFSSTSNLLGNTMKRLKGITNSGNGRLMCYLVAFVVFVFLVIYWLIR
ncbi:hypothetical protein CAOG_004731 [Capsaspora owczarzaki ATCC 30864]|uniref:t-SNARE coiled-coil homology domain-containing protein n=2 Tax=Capsaspora owczarzaki (strain ATCC 30864) TaxID=595528 RepID=A0A0D2UG00_CAPO3|nr:hypothetical protein CAOG_004731 [Capsaspora owczarzaki ATCC 30864]